MAAVVALLFILTACGYTMSGRGSQAGPTKGKYKVSVPLFVNNSYLPLLEEDVTAALKDELALDGRWVLTDTDKADLLVTGVVKGVDLAPLSYDKNQEVMEYGLDMVVEVKVTDLKTSKVVWKNTMNSFCGYRVTPDVTKTKINKEEAIKKASQNFAEEFVVRVLDSF
ncbi:MAG: LptE family protein [Nitrospirota bacterium]